jgi:ATP/maltotriose-dependent transcriptional regulator MalT
MIRASKFNSQVQVDDAVQRTRLLDRLIDSPPSTARATVLIAPAGFGKTTLLAQLASNRARGESVTVWLNCDEQDRQPEIFQASLERAFAAAGKAGELKVADLLAGIEPAEGDILLVIDEYEAAASVATTRLLREILVSLPSWVHAVVACRELPHLDLTALTLQGKLRLIDAKELRFSLDETRDLLPPDTDEDVIERVHELTEGWAFALQLIRLGAGISVKDAWLGEVRELLPAGRIFSYFASEVWRNVPDDLKQFMLDVATLHHVDAPSADWLRERTDSAQLIARMSSLHPIVAVDELRARATLHPLLREFLVHQRQQTDAAGLLRLHVKAAEFFSQRGEVYEAVGHALRSGNTTMACRIIEGAGGLRLAITVGMGYVKSLLEILPAEAIRANQRISLMEICGSIVDDNPIENEYTLEAIRREVEGSEAGSPDSVVTDLCCAECVALFEKGERLFPFSPWETLDEFKADVVERVNEDPRLLGLVLIVELLLTQRYDDFGKAELRTEALDRLNSRYRLTANGMWMPIYRAQNDYHAGRLNEAEAHLRRLLSKEFDLFRRQQNAFGQMTYALLGRIHYVRGELDEARACFQRLATRDRSPFLEVSEGVSICQAFVEAASGRWQQALERLDRELLHCQEQRRLAFRYLLNATRLELLCRRGALKEANSVYRQTLGSDDAGYALAGQRATLDIPWCVTEAFSRARFYHAMSRVDLKSAAAIAAQLQDDARRQHRRLPEIVASLFLANVSMATGKTHGAQEHLTFALTLCGQVAPAQLFLDHGVDLIPIVQEVAAGNGLGAGAATQILRVWERAFGATIRTLDFLTARESEVLIQLLHDQSTKQIAKVLQLSPETVKYHLKAIFAKLAVNTRDEAVKAAHRRVVSSPFSGFSSFMERITDAPAIGDESEH